MAKPRGRRRTVEGLSASTSNALPKIETDEHRQMRSFFLSLPSVSRTLAAVAQEFKCDYDRVWRVSRAFHWIEDSQARDAVITDPFVEQHQKEIEAARGEAFRYLTTALKLEIKRQSIQLTDEDIIEKLKTGDLEEAVKDWKLKDWMDFIKNLSMKAKDYKDFINIIDGIRKIVFEWDPGQAPKTLPGAGNKLELNNCNLIIERGVSGETPKMALPMTGNG